MSSLLLFLLPFRSCRCPTQIFAPNFKHLSASEGAGRGEQALSSSPLQISFHFPQPLQLLLQVFHSLQDILPLGIVFCSLGVQEEMFNSFREQHLGIHVQLMETQHPLAGYRVVFVPVHRMIWMRVDNFFV